MTRFTSFVLSLAVLLFWSSSILHAFASPYLPLPTEFSYLNSVARNAPAVELIERQDGSDEPQFPDQPPSCPICEANYSDIDNCAEAAPVLQNFSMIIFNPGAFIDVIECACTETFQSVYPQCVDCFIQTNQTQFLNASSSNLPSVVDGMRKICALASTLLGGVATADGEVTPTSSLAAATATSTSGALSLSASWPTLLSLMFAIVAALL